MFKNLKINTKIWIMVLISIVSLIATGVIALLFMNSINKASTEISASWMPSVIVAEELNTQTSDFRINEYIHVVSTDTQTMQEVEVKLDEINASIHQYFTEYEPLITNEVDRAMYQEALQGWNQYVELSDSMITLSRDNKTEEAKAILEAESSQVFTDVSAIFLEIVAFNKAGCDAASAEGDQNFSTAFTTMIAFVVVVLIVSIILSMLVSRSITSPVKEIDTIAQKIANEEMDTLITYQSKDELGTLAANFNITVTRLKDYMDYIEEIAAVLKEIAGGNLCFQLHYEYTGQFSKIKDALNEISDSLNLTLGNINNSSDMVASGAGQMSEAAQGLAEGATDQASIVEELVATIQTVSDKIRTNADSATNANQLVNKTRKEVERSNEQMKDMIVAISEINEKSQQIVNIVGSIQDIASQTNLLSLNASIEAARAGEAGRGFAVVADQIGKLATESATAAQNTVALIDGSIRAVEKGTVIANETASSLNLVVENVGQAANQMKIIADASKDQAESMAQVEDGVETISNVIQSNSAVAEETSATSQELNGQAQILKELVSGFTLK